MLDQSVWEGDITFHYERSISSDDEVILKDKDGMNIETVEINFAQTVYSVPPVEGGLYLYIKKQPFELYIVGGEFKYITSNYIKLLPQEKKLLIYIKDA